MFTYLILNLATLFFPLVLSFDRKVHFFKNWLNALKAIVPVGVFFIAWDVMFTEIGVWGFNHKYVLGCSIMGLPLEEWLFFITVPFACIFIYEVVINYGQKTMFKETGLGITKVLSILLFVVGLLYMDQWYTGVTFLIAGIWVAGNGWIGKPHYLGAFWLTYFLHLIPFFIVNGILTSLPVVMYNDSENLRLQMGTIPVEDAIYSLLLLLMNINLYQYFKKT